MVALNVILAQCLNATSTYRLTDHPYDDLWGAYGTYIFSEKASNGIYLVGDTVHILWLRYGVGNRYNRSTDKGNTWDYCSGSDCGGITVLSYYWESSIVAGGSKVHAVAYCLELFWRIVDSLQQILRWRYDLGLSTSRSDHFPLI